MKIVKIEYKFVAGQDIEIEVDEALGEVIIEIEKSQEKVSRKERRRHESHSNANDKQGVLRDKSVNVEAAAERNANKEKLYKAIAKLKPRQQELVKKIFYQGLSVTCVAEESGVSQQAISKQLKVIYRSLRLLLE